MKKLLVLLVVVLLTTGCSEQVRLLPKNLDKGVEFCKKNGGLKEVITTRGRVGVETASQILVICENKGQLLYVIPITEKA